VNYKLFLLSITLSFLSLFLQTYAVELTYIIPLGLLWIYTALKNNEPKSIATILISFFINYCTWVICSCGIILLAVPFRNIPWEILSNILCIIVGALHSIIIIFLFKTSRFKRGMPFIYSISSFNIITTFSTFLIIFLSYRTKFESSFIVKMLALFPHILLLLLIIHWWQAQITKSYKRSLQLRELESLRMELEEKEKRIVELEKQNEELGRLIHKDNKLIPAMEHAVHEYFITDFETLDEAKNKAQGLLLEIETLSKNRSNIIVEIHNAHSKHYETGVPSVDTLLNYMDKRARQEHISLSVHLGVDLTSYVPNTIAAEDLTHMLSDLLENAIIASKGKTNANIQLQFYISEKAFVIEIADNGAPFEIESLVNFGITQLTTHADSGGSGIGLMDIWKIKEKYFASLHIAELDASAPFTKKIAIIFNKKHRYSISSNRKDQLIAACKRADLHIFD